MIMSSSASPTRGPQANKSYGNVSAFLHLEAPVKHTEVFRKIRQDLPSSPTKITPQGQDGRCYRVFFASPEDANRAIKNYVNPRLPNSRLEPPRFKNTRQTTAISIIATDVDRTLADEDIAKQTSLQGTIQASRINSIKNGCPTSFVRLTLPDQETADRLIKNGIMINGKKHTAELPREAPRIKRCYNCQEIAAHVSSRCPKPPRCPECAGDHPPTKECLRPKKCANCGGQHAAYHKSCPAWLNKIQETKETARSKTIPTPTLPPTSPKRDQVVNYRIMERMTTMEKEINRLKRITPTREEIKQEIHRQTNSLDIKIDQVKDELSSKIEVATSDIRTTVAGMAAAMNVFQITIQKQLDAMVLNSKASSASAKLATDSDSDDDLIRAALPEPLRPKSPKRTSSPATSPNRNKKGRRS